MSTIAQISNNEAGNSVRFKLNQVISAINAGNLTNTILSGQGLPNNALGKNGDFYINLLNLEFYGPKVGNAWPLPGISLIGPKGDIGSTILSGSGIPAIELGVVGDYYFDNLNSDFYGPKTEGGWGFGINLKGDPGADGVSGPPGADGADGAAATIAVGTVTTGAPGSSATVVNAGTTSAAIFNFTIPQGATGATGPAGMDGKTILNGTGVPSGGLGTDGDFYIDTTADAIYGPKTAGAWGSPTSLIGPQGEVGPVGATGATGTVSATSGLTLEHIATPSAPAAGNTIVYAKTDGLLYYRPAGGSETPVGGVSDGDKGDITVSGGGATWTLDDTTVTPGSYTNANITVDSKGRITAASSGPAINAQSGTSYTLALTDAQGIVTMSNAAANTLSIPANASVALPVGTMVEVWRLGAGITTINAPSGVTLNGVSAGGVALGAAYAPATLRKIGTDAWLIAVGGAANVA